MSFSIRKFSLKKNIWQKIVFSAATYVLGNVEEVSAEDWSRLFDTNVRGYALMAKYIAPIFKKTK